MVDLEALAQRAERTAARSRVRMACRIWAPIAVLALPPIIGGASVGACVCVTAALCIAAAVLRWRDRIGVESVTAGLALGAIPVGAALILRHCGIECGGLPALAAGPLTCSLAGALAGIGVTWRAWHATVARRQRWLTTMLIALATAALGCAGMGAAVIATTLLAIVVAAALALIPSAVRHG